MELLSALSLGELALSFSRVPLFPVFDLSYFIVSILYLKYEPGEPGRGARGGRHRGAGVNLRVARCGKPPIVAGHSPRGWIRGAAGAGIVRFLRGERAGGGRRPEGGQGEKPPGWGGRGGGGLERNAAAQSGGNGCWGGG